MQKFYAYISVKFFLPFCNSNFHSLQWKGANIFYRVRGIYTTLTLHVLGDYWQCQSKLMRQCTFWPYGIEHSALQCRTNMIFRANKIQIYLLLDQRIFVHLFVLCVFVRHTQGSHPVFWNGVDWRALVKDYHFLFAVFSKSNVLTCLKNIIFVMSFLNFGCFGLFLKIFFFFNFLTFALKYLGFFCCWLVSLCGLFFKITKFTTNHY